MDAGADDRTPFVAVLLLSQWAVTLWPVLDGQLQLHGVDIEERAAQPAYRWFALLEAMVRERIQWAPEEDRKKITDLLDWPDVVEARTLEDSDREAREAMAMLGVSVDWESAAAAYAAREAAMHAAGETGEQNGPVSAPDGDA